MFKRYKHLNGEERGVILAEHRRGASLQAIGLLLGRSASTIGRELFRGRPEGEPALLLHRLGPFQIKAAIAACHVRGPVTDWAEIAELFATLYRFEPTPVVALNHAVALGKARGPQAGLQALLPLAADLADY